MPNPVTIHRSDLSEGVAALLNRPYSPPSVRQGIIGWVLFLSCAVGLYLLLKNGSGGEAPAPSKQMNTAQLIAVGLVIVGHILLIIIWFFVFRKLRIASETSDEVTITLISDGISFNADDVRHEFPWTAFDQFAETPRLFALRQADGVARVIPKAAFNSLEEIQQFREAVTVHVAPVLHQGETR